jgi:hypothetical protein
MTQPSSILNQNKWRLLSLLLALCILGSLGAATIRQQEDNEPDQQRRAWNKQFKTARQKVTNRPTSGRPKRAAENDLVGLTLWRLRTAPASNAQDRPRLLVQEGKGTTAKTTSWKAERVEVGTTFNKDEPVRLSIEVPSEGDHYLYVIDREMLTDGALGEPYLIFPTQRTRGGDNLITAGKLVDIPAATDNPPFFSFKGMQPNVVGERLTMIVSPKPLDLPPLGDGPMKLKVSQVEKWEKDWGGESEKPLEASKLVGKEWTAEEKASANEPQRLLTQGDPLPQTIFRVKGKSAGPLLIVVPLRVKP